MLRALAITALAASLLSGCDGAIIGPVDRLEVRVAASPERLQLGESVRVTGFAHNPTSSAIESRECGGGIKLSAFDEDGDVIPILHGGLCIFSDSNLIEPGETDAVSLDWTPSEPGRYPIRAWFTPEGFDVKTHYSPPATVGVRPR